MEHNSIVCPLLIFIIQSRLIEINLVINKIKKWELTVHAEVTQSSKWRRIWDPLWATKEGCLLWKILFEANATHVWRHRSFHIATQRFGVLFAHTRGLRLISTFFGHAHLRSIFGLGSLIFSDFDHMHSGHQRLEKHCWETCYLPL